MERILILAGEDVVIRNILFTDFLPHLRRILTEEIVIAIKPERMDYMQKALPEYTFVAFKHEQFSKLDRVVGWALLKASNTETMCWLTWNAYYMGIRSLWKVLLDRCYERVCGRSKLLKRIFRYVYLRSGKDGRAQELLRTTQPDTVIALSLTNFDFDVPIAREAKRSGIRLIAMVRSWDALVTHGALRVIPDVFIIQNEFLKTTGELYQALPAHVLQTEPVGLPHYDIAVRGALNTREETFRHFGLDPHKRLILYAAMGDSFRHESLLLPFFDALIRDEIPSNVQFLYRPHPATSRLGRGELVPVSHIHIDPTVGFVNESDPRDDARGAIARRFFSLIAQADVVITAGSTVVLDAAALHRPTICINFEPSESRTPYWLSVKAVYEYFTHFIEYMKTGAADFVDDPAALPAAIRKALGNPTERTSGIHRATELFLAPHDGNAGKRLAERIARELKSTRS